MSTKVSNLAKTGKVVAKPYDSTPEERSAKKALVARQKEKPPAPRIKASDKAGVAQISPDHVDTALGQALLMQAIGTTDLDLLCGLLEQLADAGSQGRKVDARLFERQGSDVPDRHHPFAAPHPVR